MNTLSGSLGVPVLQYGLQTCCLALNKRLRHSKDTLKSRLGTASIGNTFVLRGQLGRRLCYPLSNTICEGVTRSDTSPSQALHIFSTVQRLWPLGSVWDSQRCRGVQAAAIGCPQTLFLAPSVRTCALGVVHLCVECWWHMVLCLQTTICCSLL